VRENPFKTQPYLVISFNQTVNKVEKKEMVQIERFGQVVNWFGPLKQPDSSRTIFDTVRQVLSQK